MRIAFPGRPVGHEHEWECPVGAIGARLARLTLGGEMDDRVQGPPAVGIYEVAGDGADRKSWRSVMRDGRSRSWNGRGDIAERLAP